ncbi:MAG: hypothetical protein COU27_01520, partial [Candidatus Levybacteria bacterium CG10_big_fil_rev_8_21_14_0_10_36_7]
NIKGIDLIYALDPVSVGVPAMFISVLFRKRFVVRIAGDYAWEQGIQRFKVKDNLDVFSQKNVDYLLPVLVLKKVQKMVVDRAENIIVPSEYLKRIVSNWGISGGRINVIHTVAEEIPFQGRKDGLRKMVKFNGRIVISAGRLVPWKGFDTLIEIVPKLVKRYPSFKLIISGDGPDFYRLDSMVSQKKLDQYVSLTGSLDRDVLFKYIRMSDVFVLNTNYEGFSHQLLEVMGIGTPIVTTNVGGNPELIKNEKNGLLIKYNNKKQIFDAIVRVLDSEQESQKFVRTAQETLKKFSVERMIPKLIDILKL